MKRLVLLLLTLTPWVMHSMEPEEVTPKAEPVETLAKLYPEGRGRWVRLVEEIVPGYVPPASRISQVIAQEVLQKGPPIRQFILSHISVPFKDFVDHTGDVESAVFNSTGDQIVTGSKDRTAKIWDVKKNQLLHTLEGHTEYVQSAVFNSRGDKIVTRSMDRTAKIWDVKEGDLLYTLRGHTGGIPSAVFNPAGDKVVTGSYDGTAKLWNAVTGKLIHTLEGHEEDVTSAMFNPVGDKIATGSYDGTAKVWSVRTGAPLYTFQGQPEEIMWVRGFNPAGDKLVTTPSGNGIVRIWNVETGELLHSLQGSEQVDQAEFSPAGNQLLTGTVMVGNARIWDVETGTLLREFEDMMGKFSPAGDKVVTTSASGDDDVRMWDVETGELLYTLTYEERISPDLVEFTPAGDKVLVAFGNGVRVWDLEPFLSSEKFLAEDITLRQVAILNDIFEIKRERDYVKALQKKAFEEGAPKLRPEDITFDFNKYPHLWDDYKALPDLIKQIFDPYITKPSLRH